MQRNTIQKKKRYYNSLCEYLFYKSSTAIFDSNGVTYCFVDAHFDRLVIDLIDDCPVPLGLVIMVWFDNELFSFRFKEKSVVGERWKIHRLLKPL